MSVVHLLICCFYVFGQRTVDGNGCSTVVYDSEGPSKRSHPEEQKDKASSTIGISESVDLSSSEDDDNIPISRKIVDRKNFGRVKAESVSSQTLRQDIPGNNKSIELVEPKIISAENFPHSAARVHSSSKFIYFLEMLHFIFSHQGNSVSKVILF